MNESAILTVSLEAGSLAVELESGRQYTITPRDWVKGYMYNREFFILFVNGRHVVGKTKTPLDYWRFVKNQRYE